MWMARILPKVKKMNMIILRVRNKKETKKRKNWMKRLHYWSLLKSLELRQLSNTKNKTRRNKLKVKKRENCNNPQDRD
jgi:hypothetical protein